ncbi:MAG TPA: (Fe-S)-binding protein [Syntrophales bacterium]|nr:(Fe-S)-binding protein [Syntrophales bacterium]
MAGKMQTRNIQKFSNELKQCIECGNCTFWCPIYQQRPQEEYVARGKNKIVRSLLDGRKEYTPEVVDILGMCTLCGTCAQHCPVGSKFQSIIISARADKTKSKGIGFPMGLIYRQLIPRRKLFGAALRAASFFQKILLPKAEGKMRHLPLFVPGMFKGRQVPTIADRYLRDRIPEVNKATSQKEPKYRVAYFMGCATDFVFPEIGEKAVEYLTKNGVEVIVPKEQGCCGAPIWLGAGDFDTGRIIADRNAKIFQDADFIITNCATCSSALKEYPKYLADNDERLGQYAKFSGKIYDISEFIVDVLKPQDSAIKADPRFGGKVITWHDPCHLRRYQKIHTQPRELLTKMKDIRYEEMREAERCCGMAGAFSVYHYDVSKEISDKKAQSIRETSADIVATGCPGCMIQLADTLGRNKINKEVKHIVELLD